MSSVIEPTAAIDQADTGIGDGPLPGFSPSRRKPELLAPAGDDLGCDPVSVSRRGSTVSRTIRKNVNFRKPGFFHDLAGGGKIRAKSRSGRPAIQREPAIIRKPSVLRRFTSVYKVFTPPSIGRCLNCVEQSECRPSERVAFFDGCGPRS